MRLKVPFVRRGEPRHTLLRSALFLLLASGTALPANAQQAEEQPASVFTEVVEVRVIDVEVFVTDRSGEPIAGLTPDDFELLVDGEVTPISNFYAEAGGVVRDDVGALRRRADRSFFPAEDAAVDANRRAHVVVLVDHTRISSSNRKRAFEALRRALPRLGEEDLVAVVGIEGPSLVFYSDFLFDRRALERILDDVSKVSKVSQINDFERRQIFGELARGQSGGIQARASLANEQLLISRIRAYAAEEYERSMSSLRQIQRVVSTLTGLPGRKAVLYLAEGIPTRPGEGLFVEWRNRFGQGNPNAEIGLRRFDFNTDYDRAVGRFDLDPAVRRLAETANRAGVTLYAVDAEGNHGAEIRSALTEQGATSETLSVVDENFRAPLEAASKATGGRLLRSSGLLTDQLVDMVGDFDTFYSLGFTPPADWEAGSSHDIEVRLTSRDLLVRHREAVRMPEPDEREAGALVAALVYQTVDNPLGINAKPGSRNEARDGIATLPVTLEIPVGNLDLVPTGSAHAGSLTIYVTTKNAEGEASRVQKIPFHLSIPNEMFERAQGELAHYPLPLVLRPGDQQVAIGVRDDVTGAFSAVRLDVTPYSRF